MERRYRSPEFTTQIKVCPIPFRWDPYTGCVHGCKYCFGRNMVEFSKRHMDIGKKEFESVTANRPDLMGKWLDKCENNDYNYDDVDQVAAKERIPIKVGTTSDPFPPQERTERVTFDALTEFYKRDYPIQILTKNPVILSEYINKFEDPNFAISVSLISLDEKMIKGIEPGAPTPKERLSAIKKMTEMGYKIMVKVQPAIYPRILQDLPNLIEAIKESGAWAFNTEGMKVRITMHKSEMKLFESMTPYVGYDVRKFYSKHGLHTASDFELPRYLRMEYINLAVELGKKYGLKYYVADNGIGKVGEGAECCGTENLRGYKIWGGNEKSFAFGVPSYASKELDGCIVRRHFGKTGYNDQFKLKDEYKSKTTLFSFVESETDKHKEKSLYSFK